MPTVTTSYDEHGYARSMSGRDDEPPRRVVFDGRSSSYRTSVKSRGAVSAEQTGRRQQSTSADLGFMAQARGNPAKSSEPESRNIESEGNWSSRPPANSGTRLPCPSIKIGSYSGSGSLETFLAKFQNIARYLG